MPAYLVRERGILADTPETSHEAREHDDAKESEESERALEQEMQALRDQVEAMRKELSVSSQNRFCFENRILLFGVLTLSLNCIF